PNGIKTYYRVLAALNGLRMDFGYEFIDPDWILDFSEEVDKPHQQPWMTANRANEKSSSSPAAKEGGTSGPSPSGRSATRLQGFASKGSIPGRPMGLFASNSAGPGDPPFGSGGTGASQAGIVGTA